MWEENDKGNFIMHVKNGCGQICNDDFSQIIKNIASNDNYKTFLEIGTWNGMGSTRAFKDGFEKRKTDYILYSLECNKEKAKFASNLYQNYNNINILNEVIWNEEPENFYDIFPQCKTNEVYKKWNEVDIVNMKQCNLFLDRTELPDIFDVLLLDGGEFTTYFEFQLLKNRCKLLLLDDINVAKCTLIVKEIQENPEKWEIIQKNTHTRNGYLIAKHKI